jgi:hypothetical protein
MPAKTELQDNYISELWRRYRSLEGRDDHADLILALIRKLIIQGARNIPYGNWRERLSHPLQTYGISEAEWDS